nr:MAG TPA: hypothetical protein [Caudoviricetes sp.]
MCAWLLKGGSWNCYSCAWLFGVHIQKSGGVPYIYSSIAYDSRRGCRNVSVQWGAYPSAHERTEQVRE